MATNIREISSEELSHELHVAGKEWATTESQWFWVQEMKKVLLAELTLEYEEEYGVTKAQAKARTDRKFKDHLDAMKQACDNRNYARVRYEECQTEIKRRLNASFVKNREWNSERLNP